MLLTCLLVGLSRVYLGMHTFSQVLLGYAYSVLAIYLYYGYFKETLHRRLLSLANRPGVLSFGSWALAVLALNSLSYGLYHWRHTTDHSYDYLQKNILEAGCTFSTNKYLHHKCFITAAQINFVAGFVLGVMVSSEKSYQPGQHSLMSQLGRRLKAKTLCLLGFNYLFYKLVKSIPKEGVEQEFLLGQSLFFFLLGFN